MACFGNLSVCVSIYCLISFARFASPQNSIKPRKETAGGSDDTKKRVGQCPNIGSVMESTCRMPCSDNEDCENHGHGLLCCEALPGSVCDAECKEPVFVPNQTNTGGCLDGQGSKYKVGQAFTKSGKCCRCELGGNIDCSDTRKSRCLKGCTFNSKAYRHGEHYLTRACRNCSCSNGSIYCKADVGCLQERCQYKNKYYKVGDIIQRGHGCESCSCQASGWKCVAVSCTALANSKGSKSIQDGTYFQLCLCVSLFLRGITQA